MTQAVATSNNGFIEAGRSRRVALVYPRPTFDSVPSLCAMAEVLARVGYLVDVVAQANTPDQAPRFSTPGITFHSLGPEPPTVAPMPSGLDPARSVLALARRARGRTQARGYGRAQVQRMADLRTAIAANHAAMPYVCFVGVDPDGLALADELRQPSGAALGYVSLELLLSYEALTPEQRRLKDAERALCRQIAFAVVQDEERGRLFADDAGVPWERVALVPNAPLGPARRQPSNTLRQRLGLRTDQRIVLHAGSLGDWTGIEDVLRSVPDWPEPWHFVVHTRYDAETSDYVDRLRRQSDARRVSFSLKPLPRQEYDDLVDGADVGLAFYVPAGDSAFTGANVQSMGLSSGKLAYYARAGLPMIVNDATSVGALVAEEGCGVVVPDAAAIPAAIADVADRYAAYSARAIDFFDRRLDFARGFSTVLERLASLSAAAGACR